ncbi:kinase-like domain-containing protein [Mycena rosella]|uniref:Kinase-like domain-containing protein n=1 Tax=Mycena rosella TaxID=1033263 RepID=A0AAD7CZM2_MYCRO|nr:kinase-like domain-containing protein [Mycena rosella]
MPIQYYKPDWFNNRPPQARAKIAPKHIVVFPPPAPKASSPTFGDAIFVDYDLDFGTADAEVSSEGVGEGVDADDEGEGDVVGSEDSDEDAETSDTGSVASFIDDEGASDGEQDDGVRVKYLNRGEHSNVYMGMDLATAHGELVAVKVIEKRDPYDLYHASELVTIQQEFIDEVTALSSLNHPNILQIFAIYFKDAYNTQNHRCSAQFVVQEFMRGGTLSQYMHTESERQWHEWVPLGLSQAVARHITHQIFRALAYMHSLGIAHRNLHPDNILLSKDKQPVVKISGLAWAERYQPKNFAESIFQLEPSCDEYLAPEIIIPKPSHYSSDVCANSWSAGILLLLNSAWRVLYHDRNNVSCLRWDELDALAVAPSRSDQTYPTTLPDDALALAEDGTVIVYGLSPAAYHRSLAQAPPSAPDTSENGGVIADDRITVPINGLPLSAHLELAKDALADGVRLAEDGPDFLRQLLRDAPIERLSITDALEHLWLKNRKPVFPNVVGPDSEGKAHL